jgi:hypothetical protein
MPIKSGTVRPKPAETACGADRAPCETASGFGRLASCFCATSSHQRRQRPPLLERRGEPSGIWRPNGAAPCVLSGRDSQRPAWCQTIVTPDGLPRAYEVMPGNTSDKTTLRDFLQRIEAQYGKAGRTWVMDRGIPTHLCWPRCGRRRHRRIIWSAAAWAPQSNGDGLPGQAMGGGA